MSRLGAWRGFLSAFIVFHLLAVLIAPNAQSYLGEFTKRLLEPYVGALEFAGTWNFFAPEPGPPPLYVEWQLSDRSDDPIAHGTWPDVIDPYSIRERQNRRIAAARFMMLSDDRLDKMMTSYLCGRYPEANAVRLSKVAYTIPTRDEVESGKRKIGDDSHADRRFVAHSFCPRANR